MALFKTGKKSETGSVSIQHYAPDVSLTAVDYVIPVLPERRIQAAKRQIADFLAQTNPDSLCEGFYDMYAEKEDSLIVSMIREQIPEHRDANKSIACKHKSELVRLGLSIGQLEEAMKGYDTEIAALQELYDRFN